MKALVLIDIQQGFDKLDHWGGNRNNPDAEAKAAALLKFFRNKNWPVYHVQHCSTNPLSPLRPGSPGNALHQLVTPVNDEPVIKKEVNSAFIGTPLEDVLKDKQTTKLVMAGLTTDHCVSTSVRMAANLGFDVTLIEDATATFDKIDRHGKRYDAQLIHDTAIASLNEEFARIMTLEEFVTNPDQ